MEPLFIKKPSSHVKEAAYRLGHDAETWDQDIVAKLHEEHAYLPDYNVKVALNHKDADAGAATGQITLDNKVRIPVVIQDFKLQPMDLMYHDEQLMPLSKQAVARVMHDGSFGKAIKPQSSGVDMGLFAATRAPHYGKYAYASSLEYTPQNLADAISSAYSENELRYDLADSKYLRQGIMEFAKEASMEKVASEDAPQVTIKLLKEAHLTDVKSGGVRTAEGEGVMFKVASSNGQLLNRSLFVGTEGGYAFGESAPGVEANVKLASSEPAGYGVFFASLGEKNVCTEPLNIQYKTAEYVAANTAMGENVRIYQDSDFSGFRKIANCIYLSDAWSFAPLKERVQFSNASDMNKLAALGADFEVRRVGNFYRLEGNLQDVPALAKLANTMVDRHELQNGFTAYCSPEQFDEICAQADKAIAAKIKTYRVDPETEDVYELPKLAAADKVALIRSAGILTEEVVKQAGVEPGDAESTVDSILGLNFLSQENIHKMVLSIDDLEAARGVLSRVLLAGRLGLDIDVSTVRTAMFALDAVVGDLRRLRQTHLAK